MVDRKAWSREIAYGRIDQIERHLNVNPEVFPETNMCCAKCLDSWMENYVKIRCEPTTIRNYETYLRAIRHETVQRVIFDLRTPMPSSCAKTA